MLAFVVGLRQLPRLHLTGLFWGTSPSLDPRRSMIVLCPIRMLVDPIHLSGSI